MLRHNFHAVLFSEIFDESRVPEFTCNPKILACSHKGIGLAAFGSGGNSRRVKVVLLAAGNRDQTAVTNEAVFPCNRVVCDDGVAPGGKAPSTRAECLIQNPSVLDFWEVDNSI